MILLYSLKVTWFMAATAVAELWATGDCWIALAALSVLLTMGYATRLYARGWSRPGGSA